MTATKDTRAARCFLAGGAGQSVGDVGEASRQSITPPASRNRVARETTPAGGNGPGGVMLTLALGLMVAVLFLGWAAWVIALGAA